MVAVFGMEASLGFPFFLLAFAYLLKCDILDVLILFVSCLVVMQHELYLLQLHLEV